MESIAVTKPHMGVLSQERLALSPFGALAQSFAEELMARTGQEEGQWSYVPLDLLQEEEESSPPPPAQTVLQVDLKLVLDGLRKAKPNAEYLRATERIVERILQRREIQREVTGPVPADQTAPFTAPAPQKISQLQQHIFQTLNQMVSIQLPEKSHPGNTLRQRAGTLPAETGRPGQLGQRAENFSHTLRILREEGKSFPAQPAANQQAAPLSTAPGPAPEAYEAPLALEHVAEQEDAAVEAARQGSVQAATQLLRTAERLERMIQTETTTRVGEKPIQTSHTTPISQNIGPNQEHHLPTAPGSRVEPSGSLHKLETSATAEQREISLRIETAAQRIDVQARQAEQQEQNQQTQLLEQGQQTTARDIRTVQSEQVIEPSRVQIPAEAVPGVELSHREVEEQKQQQEPTTHVLEKGQQTTARDIRTIQPEQVMEPVPAPQIPTEVIPGVELSHREVEEQKQQQEPTTHVLEKGQQTMARDIRTVQPEQAAESSPVQVPAEAVPGVELTHREVEEQKQQQELTTHVLEKGQQTTARDIRTVQPEQVMEPSQVQIPAEAIPGIELTHREVEDQEQRQEATTHALEKGQQTAARDIRTVQPEQVMEPIPAPPIPSEAVPGVELTHREVEDQEQQQEPTTHALEKGQHTTARDIRTVQPEQVMEPSQVQIPAEAIPGIELTHREVEDQEQNQKPVTHALEKGQQTTARDIRTVQPEQVMEPIPAPPIPSEAVPGVELTHREVEDQEQRQEPGTHALEKGQHTTARDIRTVQPEQVMEPSQVQIPAEAIPGVELTHREVEEQEQRQELGTHALEKGQQTTARDIRMVQPEKVMEPSQVQIPAEAIPGIELTHREVEDQEQNQEPGAHTLEKGQQKTARDIRTVQPEQVMEPIPAPPIPSETVPGVELTHREVEDQEQQQEPTTHALEKGQQTTARDIRMVQPEQVMEPSQVQIPAEAVSGVELTHREVEDQEQQQKPTTHTLKKDRHTTAQDIRTVQPEQVIESSSVQIPAEAIPGVELTHREVEPELKQLQPRPSEGVQRVELSRGRERPPASPAFSNDRAGIIERKNTPRMSPMTVLNGDIRVARQLTGRGSLPAVDREEEQPVTAAVPGLTLDYTGSQRGEVEESAFSSPSGRRSETADRPVELAYGPSQPAAEQPPVQPGQSAGGQRQEESDYVRSLPDWARNFLRESWASPPQEMGVARNISTQPVAQEETIQWTAPNYQPAPQLTHREKQQEERPQKPQQVHLSEAEIQRAADKVYRIIEDRIREERIRFGF